MIVNFEENPVILEREREDDERFAIQRKVEALQLERAQKLKGYDSFRDMLYDAVQDEIAVINSLDSSLYILGLIKWLSEDECEKFCHDYEIDREEE